MWPPTIDSTCIHSFGSSPSYFNLLGTICCELLLLSMKPFSLTICRAFLSGLTFLSCSCIVQVQTLDYLVLASPLEPDHSFCRTPLTMPQSSGPAAVRGGENTTEAAAKERHQSRSRRSSNWQLSPRTERNEGCN